METFAQTATIGQYIRQRETSLYTKIRVINTPPKLRLERESERRREVYTFEVLKEASLKNEESVCIMI